MSRCFTVTYTGMVPGIAVSGTHQGRPYVTVGAEYVHEGGVDGGPGELRRQPNKVLLDRFKPPTLENDRLTAAHLVRGGGHIYLGRAKPCNSGVLVYINTGHEGPCVIGGHWTAEDSALVQEICHGREGHRRYRQGSHDLYIDSFEQVDDETCYAVALLLLMPGARVNITFNAPGQLVGEVAFDSGEPTFRTTVNAIDPDYTYEPPDYEYERLMSSFAGGRLFHDDPYDDGFDLV